MSDNPLVTIVIPCFNAAATVAPAIASARAQTYRPIEIIAIDDKSRDETLAILRRDAGDDLRVIACAENGGAAAARNRAIAVANGKYLAFLDADDVWAEDKLARQIVLLEKHPDLVMAGCRAEVVRLGGVRESVNADRVPPHGAEAWRALLHHSFYVPSVVIARTDVARRIGGFSAAMRAGEDDQDFFIRMALEGAVGFVDASLVTMLQQPDSLSIVNYAREYQTLLPMILRHCEALRDRLSTAERRRILGARYASIGRGVYLASPPLGARLLGRAILAGNAPVANLYYLLTASPWARWFKARLFHSTGAETLART
jgi:glycosyltransferase involved in cell wall biosynthesis